MDQTRTDDILPPDQGPADTSADDTVYAPIAEEMVDDALARAEAGEADEQTEAALLVDPDADIYEATATKLVDGMLEPHGLAPDDAPTQETGA